MNPEQPNFITKKSLMATLRALPVGKPVVIKEKDFRYSSLRTARYVLRKEGIMLEVSQKGMIGETKVTRLS